MTLKNRLKKIEQKINISGIPKEVFKKVGYMPICEVDATDSAEVKEALANKTRDEFFAKLANELKTTPEKAKEIYYKENKDPLLIIEFVE